MAIDTPRPVSPPIGAPDFGRTVRVVGPVENVDPQQLPHPRNHRGELGKPLFNWIHNTIAPDPLGRIAFDRQAADKANVFRPTVLRVPKGARAAERVAVDDPAAMTCHIKAAARYLGADVVGVGRAHASFVYGGAVTQDGMAAEGGLPEKSQDLVQRLPFVLVATHAWDYDLIQAHRHRIGDAAYEFSGGRALLTLFQLAAYIRELGYDVEHGRVNPQAAALAAGVGELGRNGMVITESHGAGVHFSDALITNLPLVPGKPLDIGVEDFCKVCRKCATTCPTNSIPFGGKQVHNGIEKYKIKWETCYRLRPFVSQFWITCLTCITVCPYTKPNSWWRRLATAWLRHTPIPLRPLPVRVLKWLDDRLWGVVPRKRVRWLGYDSGVKPGEQACTVAGCTASHGEAGMNSAAGSRQGYYFPLKENVNRFAPKARA